MDRTWHIYSQNIDASTFNTRYGSVTIDAITLGRFKTRSNFPLTPEAPTFTPVSGQQYYVGSGTYLYRAQVYTNTNNGRQLLAGHVSNSGLDNRCAFAGLPSARGSFRDVDKIEGIQAFYIHLDNQNTTPHTTGTITIIRRPAPGIIRVTRNGGTINFDIKREEATSDGGILLTTKPRTYRKNGTDYVEVLIAKIIFDTDRYPIYIGYHWRSGGFDMGPPVSQYCTRVTIGLGNQV